MGRAEAAVTRGGRDGAGARERVALPQLLLAHLPLPRAPKHGLVVGRGDVTLASARLGRRCRGPLWRRRCRGPLWRHV